MIDINSIIIDLSQNEKQEFVNYLKQKNKRADIKNIKLFTILSENKMDSKSICKILYGTDNKNAYHALRKRLYDSLIDFTANKNLEDENSIDMQIIKYILASRTFLLQKKFSNAFKLLDKAEKLAIENSLYPILNEIYHTKIQYAPEYPKANLEQLIKKQTNNQKKHQLEDQLNIVYSKLKTVLNGINKEKNAVDFENILQKTLQESNIKLKDSLSFKSLYQILAIANISALATSKYYEIEDFVLKSYTNLKTKKETDKQLFYQIEIVYIIANTLFRNRKFKASLDYIHEMESLMRLKKGKYYKDFFLKYTLVKTLNFNYSNSFNKAILILENTISKKNNNNTIQLDLQLTLLLFYFQQSKFKNAKKIISEFYHTDNWYIEKTSMDWVIKKNIAEILLYIEIDELDLFESRLKSFKRNFSKYLNNTNQNRILIFLDLAKIHYNNPKQSTSEVFKNKVKSSFTWSKINEEDIFVISFYAWLKSKTNNTPLYETTLHLLKK